MGCGFGDNHVAGRMTSFGWKRKRCLHSSSAAIFKKDEEEDSVDSDDAQVVDWLSGAKRRRAILLEDCQAKSKRLQDEGVTLAENERYWEAIKHWDEALELTPSSAVLHEMKSQVWMIEIQIVVWLVWLHCPFVWERGEGKGLVSLAS